MWWGFRLEVLVMAVFGYKVGLELTKEQQAQVPIFNIGIPLSAHVFFGGEKESVGIKEAIKAVLDTIEEGSKFVYFAIGEKEVFNDQHDIESDDDDDDLDND
jgi:hypothetical protein